MTKRTVTVTFSREELTNLLLAGNQAYESDVLDDWTAASIGALKRALLKGLAVVKEDGGERTVTIEVQGKSS